MGPDRGNLLTPLLMNPTRPLAVCGQRCYDDSRTGERKRKKNGQNTDKYEAYGGSRCVYFFASRKSFLLENVGGWMTWMSFRKVEMVNFRGILYRARVREYVLGLPFVNSGQGN